MAADIKIESGLQLIARLSRKKGIQNFYPLIFDKGPECGHVIELFSDQSTVHLLEDIISESLVPTELDGVETKVLIFNTDGNFNLNSLTNLIRRKLHTRLQCKKSNSSTCDNNNTENLIINSLKNLFILELYNITQFYTTILNLENILAKHLDISIVVFNSLTAFYWSEQDYNIQKKDIYLKKLLSLIQKVTKDHKVTLLYTRPENFSSKKEFIENMEPCHEHATEEKLNYRIQVVYTNNEKHYVKIKTHDCLKKVEFLISNDCLEWLIDP